MIETADIVSATDVEGWIPFRFSPRSGQIFVEWIERDGRGFPEPFFNQTMERRYRESGGQTRTTRVEELLERAASAQSLPLSGFIFHTSRCGSTLLTNALKTAPGALVLSEPHPLNQLIGYPHRRHPSAPWAAWFRALITCLTEACSKTDRLAFIKFSSHASLEIDLIAGLFPTVPQIALFRDPLAVIVSVLEEPTYWMGLRERTEKAAKLLGVQPAEISNLSAEDYCAFALGRICQSLLDHTSKSACFLNYGDLNPSTIRALSDHLGLAMRDEDLANLALAFAQDAKCREDKTFFDDVQKKASMASPAMRASCRRYLSHVSDRMDERRLASPTIRLIKQQVHAAGQQEPHELSKE